MSKIEKKKKYKKKFKKNFLKVNKLHLKDDPLNDFEDLKNQELIYKSNNNNNNTVTGFKQSDIKFKSICKEKLKPNTRAYLTLITNFGNLNLMLYCDLAPKACLNFITLCSDNKYNNCVFHRLIKGFMIQGGNIPHKSIYKCEFEDEFYKDLKHEGEGILSMANSGPNTNGTQFFITFNTALHLDKKHTIFGKVVGGLTHLEEVEEQPTDTSDKPINPLYIKSVRVYNNPFINKIYPHINGEILK